MSDKPVERLARRIATHEMQIDGLIRTQQVARTLVGGVTVEDALVKAGDTADRVDGIGGDVARLDDGKALDAWDAAQQVPTADGYLDDLSQRQDEVADLASGLDGWRDERYDIDELESVEQAGLRADLEQAGRELEEARVELDGKLADFGIDLAEADGRITEAKDRADTAFGKADTAETAAGTADTKAQSALTMAGSKARVTYSTTAPSGTANEGDIHRRLPTAAEITAGATAGDIMQEWRSQGGVSWQEVKVSTTAIANLDVGKLTVQSGVISELVAQHIAGRTATFQAVNASNIFVTGTAAIQAAVVEKLWADVVKAKMLTVTEKIIANDIFAAGVVGAAALSATAVDGKLITGAFIRTAATGQRWEMSASGLRGYDSSNINRINLYPDSGGFIIGPAGVDIGNDGVVGDYRTMFQTNGLAYFSKKFASGWDTGTYIGWNGFTLSKVPGSSNQTEVRRSTAVSRGSVNLQAQTALNGEHLQEVHLNAGAANGPEISMAYDVPNSGAKPWVNASLNTAGLNIDSGTRIAFLGSVTTPGNVFALKSQLNAWTTAIDGTYAWVTAEGRGYLRAGGAWRALVDVSSDTNGTVTLPGTRAAGFSSTVSNYEIRGGIVFITLSITGSFPVGSGVDVWSGITSFLRPPSNRMTSVWMEGGYSTVAWVRSNGTIAVANQTGGTRTSAQFTIIYPLV